MRVTLDSGILVRASASLSGPAFRLVVELAPPSHQIVLSEFILDDLQRVLSYPRLQARYALTGPESAESVKRVRNRAEMVEPALGPPVVRNDPDDDPVIYTA